MAAPKGNQFWKARSSHGRKPIFASPEQLEESCLEYFQWVEDNPLIEEKASVFQGEVTYYTLNKMRAMSLEGLTNFLDIGMHAWYAYEQREGFQQVTHEARKKIEQQQFEGASAEFLNANIIARKLGLSDKRELSGKDGGPIEHTINYMAQAAKGISEIQQMREQQQQAQAKAEDD